MFISSPFRHVNWYKWLLPGISVKRWLLLAAVGILLISLGIMVWVIYPSMKFIPNSVCGSIFIALGLVLNFWGQSRAITSIANVIQTEGNEELVDLLLDRRRLDRGPKIVVIGGGTGLSNLLRGLKHYSANITAIVTVADDGGSSGRLRRENGILPPGDIRNCMAALADEEKLLTEMFQYRFQSGQGLTGHSFGNLFLTAMNEIVGDFERAIALSSKVLAIRGRVLPSTLSDVRLWAELSDGRRIEGESQIPEARGRITKIGCTPANPPALPTAIAAIKQADYIVIGPGSLYTSIIPNLLVPEIKEAIALSQAPKIYICNIMTQAGETNGYRVSDHIRALDKVCGQRLFDTVLVSKKMPSAKCLRRYALLDDSHFVFLDRENVSWLGRKIFLADVTDEDEKTGYIRHNSPRLASALQRWYANTLIAEGRRESGGVSIISNRGVLPYARTSVVSNSLFTVYCLLITDLPFAFCLLPFFNF